MAARHHPGEEEDRGGAGAVPRPGRRTSCPRRLDGVLSVVHLVLTTGHTAPTGATLGPPTTCSTAPTTWPGCCARGFPDDPDVAGLLALVLLTDARRGTRVGADGGLVLLADQDRSRWDPR